MSHSATHLWLLVVQPKARQTFDRLLPAHKRAVFRHLQDLLTADDPYSRPFVEMLKSAKFVRIRKFRVGNYRVFFVVEPVQAELQGHSYKGKLVILEIRARKDAY
jgi:mRNA-degrading endonuclease RelE of RelBE toxin-antitoxin system